MITDQPAAARRGAAVPTASPRWPAHAIVVLVGLFCLVVGALWVLDHVVGGTPVDETGWVVLGSLVLRGGTIVVALASVARWGERLPAALVLTGLWGCAAAQLVYPLAELVAKTLVLVGVLDLPPRGVGDLGPTGWFNLAAVWLVFGVPGLLFVAAARSWTARHGGSWRWPVVGLLSGAAALLTLGLIIG